MATKRQILAALRAAPEASGASIPVPILAGYYPTEGTSWTLSPALGWRWLASPRHSA